jgi:hypothetical protein
MNRQGRLMAEIGAIGVIFPAPDWRWYSSTIQASSAGFYSGRLSRLPHSCRGTGSTMRSPKRAGSAGTRYPPPLRR